MDIASSNMNYLGNSLLILNDTVVNTEESIRNIEVLPVDKLTA